MACLCGAGTRTLGAPLPPQDGASRVVEPLSRADGEQAIQLAVESFLSTPEPFLDWVCGPEHAQGRDADAHTRREGVARSLYTWCWSLCSTEGRCFGVRSADGAQLDAAVFCLPPCAVTRGIVFTPLRFLRTMWRVGVPEIYALHREANRKRYGSGPSTRLDAADKLQTRMHARCAPTPHWYVFLLGVRSGAQRSGLGALLLRTVERMAELDKVPVYLECCGASNRDYYLSRGFTVAAECELPSDGNAPTASAYGMLLLPPSQKAST